MTYTFQHLPHPTGRDWSRVQTIYERTFAEDLRHPFEDIREDVRLGARLLYVARQRRWLRRPVVGMALVAWLPGMTGVYGEYIGTEPALQNQGIGRQLFEYVTGHLRTLPGVDALVIDAEAPKTGAPDDIDRRRLRFHERLGMRHIPAMAHYRVPVGAATVPMCLMWTPLGVRTAAPGADEVAGWVRGIFAINGYDDALAEQLIAAMDPGAGTGVC